MKTKIDKQIKNYLRKISFDIIKSKINESIHYKITVAESIVHVRFSKHFSPRTKKETIDIIKIQDGIYTVRYNGISTTITSNDILDYIKALIITYNEFNPLFNKIIKLTNKVESLNRKLDKDQLNIQLSAARNTNETLKEKYLNLIKENEQLQKNIKGVTAERKLLKTEIDGIRAKFNKIKEFINKG